VCGLRLCELEREQEGVNIIVPKSWCLFQTIKCLLESDNDHRCTESFRPAFGQGHVDIIVIDLGIEKCSHHHQMIDVSALFSDQGDDLPKSGEFSDRGIGFSKGCLIIAFDYEAWCVSYGAGRIVLCLVDPLRANWRESHLHSFPGVDGCECVIEQDRCAFFFHCSFPVVSL
jgi:hypothetical protein